MSREQLIFIILLCIILVQYVVYVSLTIDLAIKNVVYSKDLLELEDVRRQNVRLKAEILEQSSYTTLYNQAIKKGFVNAKYIYLAQ